MHEKLFYELLRLEYYTEVMDLFFRECIPKRKLQGDLIWQNEFYVDSNEIWTMPASQECSQKCSKEGV